MGARVETILDVVDRLVDFTIESLCVPFVADGMYRRGFLFALVLGFVLGKVGSWLLFMRYQILAFFQPSALPATRPGPSGSDRAKGCGCSVVKLIGAAIIMLLLLAALIASQIRGMSSP